MTPTVDGEMHHFVNAGLYDALFVMQDTETRSLWNHITGTAMYGPLAGHQLPVSNLLQMNVSQALALDPEMEIAISERGFGFGGGRGGARGGARGGIAGRGGPGRGAPPAGARGGFGFGNPDDGRRLGGSQLMGDFVNSLGVEDDRRPRMELGLGIWTDTTRRYYPLETIEANNGVLVDAIDGRGLVVFVDPTTATPAALFVDATEASVDGSDIVLDGNRRIQAEMLVGSDGSSERIARPQQIFTRWYGYALTFPDPEIYEG